MYIYIYICTYCICAAWLPLHRPVLSRFFPSCFTFCQEQVLACTLRINWGLLFSKISPAQPCWISPLHLMAEAASTAGQQGPVKFSRSCHASIFSRNTHESSQILFAKKKVKHVLQLPRGPAQGNAKTVLHCILYACLRPNLQFQRHMLQNMLSKGLYFPIEDHRLIYLAFCMSCCNSCIHPFSKP